MRKQEGVETHLRENQSIDEIERSWKDSRWKEISRPYSAEDVFRLRGTIHVEHSIAKATSTKLWNLLQTEQYVPALGALTGNQAIQMVQAGLKAIYLSGWQVAADANLAGQIYPDQSLYPSNSVPSVVRRIVQALQSADHIQHSERKHDIDWLVPIIADGEAGFGGALNVFELTKLMIEAGAVGLHYEDQLSSEKKCGHLGGKVLVPTSQFVRVLVAARLASDIMDVPTVLIARTDANNANLITSDIDPRDHEFLTRDKRTSEGFHKIRAGPKLAIARALSYAPYSDLIWCETSKPDIEEAKALAEGVRKIHPSKMLAYNCSPSFNWERNLNPENIRRFQKEIAGMGYKFQFITLAGFHSLNHSIFELAREYASEGMPAYVKLQRKEFASAEVGYSAVKHQRFVGTTYFDDVSLVISGGLSSTSAMEDSTEEQQFEIYASTKMEDLK